MGFIINDFFLDFALLFLPLYFLYFYYNINTLKKIFKEQGLSSISLKKLFKHIVILFFLMFVVSYFISFVAGLFDVKDLSLVGTNFSPEGDRISWEGKSAILFFKFLKYVKKTKIYQRKIMFQTF